MIKWLTFSLTNTTCFLETYDTSKIFMTEDFITNFAHMMDIFIADLNEQTSSIG